MIPAGYNVPLSFTMPALPSAVQWRVSNPAGILQDWTALDLSTQTGLPSTITVTVPASLNLITEVFSEISTTGGNVTYPSVREGRTVDLLLSFVASPPQQITQSYVIRASDILQLMQNSFQSYPSSLEIADEVAADLGAWQTATDEQRQDALAIAYYFLSRLDYEIYYDRDDIYFRSRASWGLPYINTIGRLYNYAPSDFLNLDPDFLRAIRKAQVIEADWRLQGDPVGFERDSGLLSRTVGGASHMFRPGKPLKLSVSKKALQYLSGYIRYNARLIRS